MKLLSVYIITLLSVCPPTMMSINNKVCDTELALSMKHCFRTCLRYSKRLSADNDLKAMRLLCMADQTSKLAAKQCLLKEFSKTKFDKCPVIKTYINSVDRLFK
ncbi:unnamed protein product [Heterobilharzia americana]|nr:unnamed protein product [Heterobilharzia americana]